MIGGKLLSPVCRKGEGENPFIKNQTLPPPSTLQKGKNTMNEFEEKILEQAERIADNLEILSLIVNVLPVGTMGNKRAGIFTRQAAAGFDPNTDVLDVAKEISNKRKAKLIELKLLNEEIKNMEVE